MGLTRHSSYFRDPEGTRTDAELIAALQRAWLLPQKGVQDPVAEEKFRLDAVVGDEGGNFRSAYFCLSLLDTDGIYFSAGERQLVALTRALVKGSRIIVLVSVERLYGAWAWTDDAQRTKLLPMWM